MRSEVHVIWRSSLFISVVGAFLISSHILAESAIAESMFDNSTYQDESLNIELDRPLSVSSWSVQQGYNLDGLPNLRCSKMVLQNVDNVSDVVALHDSDSTYINGGSNDIVGYLSRQLGMHEFFGAPARRMSKSGAVLSRWKPVMATSQILPDVPASRGGPYSSRALNHVIFRINETDVHFLGASTDWHEPRVQLEKISKVISEIDGPIVLTGNFNLWPSGANAGMACQPDSCHWRNGTTCDPTFHMTSGNCEETFNRSVSAFKPLIDVGLHSAVNVDLAADLVGWEEQHCTSSIGETEVKSGCQLDYIFYRGLVLTAGGGGGGGGGTLPVDKCSDHLLLYAHFSLPLKST